VETIIPIRFPSRGHSKSSDGRGPRTAKAHLSCAAAVAPRAASQGRRCQACVAEYGLDKSPTPACEARGSLLRRQRPASAARHHACRRHGPASPLLETVLTTSKTGQTTPRSAAPQCGERARLTAASNAAAHAPKIAAVASSAKIHAALPCGSAVAVPCGNTGSAPPAFGAEPPPLQQEKCQVLQGVSIEVCGDAERY
jgi:hypothetical protein